MAPPVRLYYDLGSPYAYLAAERAGRVLGVEPELQPIVLGAIFRLRDRGSWAMEPGRERRMAEVEERARRYGLPPVTWPPGWPPNTLQANRAAVWAERRGAGRAFTLAAFRAAFAGGADLGDLGTLQAVAAAAGLPPAELAGAVADPSIKEELRERTDAAWRAGVRGAPTLAVGERLFYGDDRLEEAAAALRGA